MGRKREVAFILNNKGMIYHRKGEDDKAMEMLNESLEISKNIGDKEGIAVDLFGIALIYCMKEEYVQAINILQGASNVQNILLGIKETLGDQVYQKLTDKLQT